MYRSLTAALGAVVLFSVVFQQVACHGHRYHGRHGHHHRHGHHGHHRHHWMPVPNIEIYSPKGIELSIPKLNATAQYFAFEMYINNPNGNKPDVAHNTSELVYGKFIVRDTEVIIKPEDSLNITTYIGFNDGGVLKNNLIFRVFRQMIKNNCTCENSTRSETTTTAPIHTIPPWSRRSTNTPRFADRTTTPRATSSTTRPTGAPIRTTTVSTQSNTSPNWDEQQFTGDYSDEEIECEIDPVTNLCSDNYLIDVRNPFTDGSRAEKLITKPERESGISTLKGIVQMVSEQCAVKPRTNMLTLKVPDNSQDASFDGGLGYVRKVLKKLPKLAKVAETGLVGASPGENVIFFQTDTLINKLHVLYQVRRAGWTSVKDYDDVRG